LFFKVGASLQIKPALITLFIWRDKRGFDCQTDQERNANKQIGINMQGRELVLAMCAISAELLKSKVKFSPVGTVDGLDGRRFIIDGPAMLDLLITNDLKLPLTIEHGYSRHGEESAAWFSDYELRTDGIYATLTLNTLGTELIESERYKYLSPEYLVNYDTNQVELIVGVGLVNKPNLLNKALNNQEREMATKDADNATEIEQLTSVVESLKSQNTELQTQNSDLLKRLSTNKVDAAIGAGKLAPSKKDFALGLEANALDSYLQLEAQTFSATEDNSINPDKQDDTDKNCEIMQQLGLGGDE